MDKQRLQAHLNLIQALLIQEFPLGSRVNNLEIALTAYKQALRVFTYSAFPQNWAMIQYNLGIVYRDRIQGDRAENLEAAIAAYTAALDVYTRCAFPQDWAMTQNNLGTAYSERVRGNRAENLEFAITAYNAALEVRTRSAFPEKWAMTQDNLGSTYLDRIRGDRAENIEQAITAFHAALDFYTRSAFPQDWGIIQNRLGIAYQNRIQGKRAENLELALAAYTAALEVRTRSAFPQDWAMTQNNLGIAYEDRIQGDRAKNLEAAIAAYTAALDVYTRCAFPQDWAMTQNNLGVAYIYRIRGDRVQNLKAAITAYNAALEVRTRCAFPQNWATTQHNLGVTYRELGLITEAIACFRSALEIDRPTTFPLDCIQTGRSLGKTAFKAELWQEAIEGYGVAIDAVETSRTWVTSESRRQQILAEAFDIYENVVEACIKVSKLDKAIEYAERARSKRLVDLMASYELDQGGEIPPQVEELLQQYEKLQEQIDEERFQNNFDKNRELMGAGSRIHDRAATQAYSATIQALESEKQQIWEKLREENPVLASEIQVNAPDFAAILKLIDQPTTAILSFYTTSNDTHIFVLRQNQITLHTCTGQKLETLQNWIFYNWLLPYLSDQNTWKSQLNSFFTELAQRLQLPELISQHIKGIEELIIVPHLYLHHIPFAALPIADGQFLGNRFLIRYIPSCQILEFCHKRGEVEGSLTYGTVEDATEDLPCASFEGEQITQMYNIPENRRLKGRTQASVSNYRQLAKQVQVLHSSHHAQFRLDNPLESKLELGNGSITLGQLMTPGWRLPNLSDVFLSCCETGLGVTQITDDILTLSSGFLCAGARNVVSTLWSVDDLATALFSIFYYRHRRQGSCRPTALQQAQEELRALSGQTLATVYQPQMVALFEQQFKELDKARKEAKANRDKEAKGTQAYLKWDEEYKRRTKAAERIRKTKNRLKALCQESFPFSHPFYWAAFTCSGLR